MKRWKVTLVSGCASQTGVVLAETEEDAENAAFSAEWVAVEPVEYEPFDPDETYAVEEE